MSLPLALLLLAPPCRLAWAEAPPEPLSMLVFISLAMPEGQLRQLAAEAEGLPVALLLRSFPDAATGQGAYQSLFAGDADVKVMVDPFAFHDHGVSKVPVYMLLRSEHAVGPCRRQLERCDVPYRTAQVAGAVSIAEALRHMRRDLGVRPAADALLRKLGQGKGR